MWSTASAHAKVSKSTANLDVFAPFFVFFFIFRGPALLLLLSLSTLSFAQIPSTEKALKEGEYALIIYIVLVQMSHCQIRKFCIYYLKGSTHMQKMLAFGTFQ